MVWDTINNTSSVIHMLKSLYNIQHLLVQLLVSSILKKIIGGV